MTAIQSFYDLQTTSLRLVNSTNIILVPKKEGADKISNYRPTSLIHGISKIISKTLANQLRPFMTSLASPAQSVFIKKRSIHDNFLYVRNLALRFHRTNTAALFLKLDIAKSFDLVRWNYLLDLLQWKGFPTNWRNWITALLVTSSSRFLLNGVPGAPIRHDRGLR